jgi:hypothetical protein
VPRRAGIVLLIRHKVRQHPHKVRRIVTLSHNVRA